MPVLDASATDRYLGQEPRTQENIPAAVKAELAALRYLIILTARWKSSDSLYPQRRAELGTELEQHRIRYSQVIDEIAMKFMSSTRCVPRTAWSAK